MAEDYNPTNKVVFCSRDNLKNIGSKLIQTGGNFLSMVGLFSICPYILPTTIRSIRDVSSPEEKIKFDAIQHVGYSTGIMGGTALDIVQLMGYSYAVAHDHPEALLIPVVTNVTSGVYEFGKKMYNRAR